MLYHGHLAGSKRQRAGIKIEAALLAVEVVELERSRVRQKLVALYQETLETDPSIFNDDAHLAEPRNEIFLHLASHAGLLRSRESRRVGIRIDGDCTVKLR